MPKRKDLKSIMIIGAGPIVIGQACEFDYSGTQGVKVLKEEGYRVILVNSNPATIMTDPDMADATYIEPITPEVVEKIIEKEKPDALLPTLGGQTALNTAVTLSKRGVLKKHKVEMIGANLEAIEKAEDRQKFKRAMEKIGLHVPRSAEVRSYNEAMKVIDEIGYPAIIRAAFTLGGSGGNIAYNEEEYKEYVKWGLECSPVKQLLIEQSVLGWKEFELEVMRDNKDNVVIVCSIENLDPMGVHTGDSITVAPIQTLSDKEYQILRDASLKIIREIGVETGGSNIQFATNPKTGEMIVIEMNPRVSRSSALASKATGFPIAKFATKLAIGYSLDEIENDITKYTPASFEPTIDYVVTKIPRFTFEKFPQADDRLTTQMKSVGEVMAIGRTFKESLQKALRSLEIGKCGFDPVKYSSENEKDKKKELKERLRVPKADRLWWVAQSFREGFSIDDVYKITAIDPWFLANIKQIIDLESEISKKLSLSKKSKLNSNQLALLKKAKEYGFSDIRLSQLTGVSEDEVRELRKKNKIQAVYKRVDTCAAEFEAHTPYLYSTYEEENEANPSKRKKVMILGGGPNRIGQGIEFDYCCVHAAMALAEENIESIMVNCNPETVSTDYDTSDRLYFEPLTKEDVVRIIDEEKPDGIIVQFGGQTPLKLAVPLQELKAPIIGTSPDAIDEAEDRERFAALVEKLNLQQPRNGLATSEEEAVNIASQIGYPVLVRPSYVLGGRAMEIVYDVEKLKHYMKTAVEVSDDKPVLIDQYIDGAIEVDVDALSDGKDVVIGGMMEHIERAGVHSGDSACCLPPHSLSDKVLDKLESQTKALTLALKVKGLVNIQFAVRGEEVYLIEVNPRASRTVPFVSKAIGVPLAKLAAKVMVGKTLKQLGYTKQIIPPYRSVKEVVLPFAKFPGVDTLLGPEMKSTGEVMGIDKKFGMAFAKSQLAANNSLPHKGKAFISVRDEDKPEIINLAKGLSKIGFKLVATAGTHKFLKDHDIEVSKINKVMDGSPHVVDLISSGKVSLVVNTPEGPRTTQDSYEIRRTSLVEGIPYFTTIAAAEAGMQGIQELMKKPLTVKSIQEYRKSFKK